MKKQLLLLVAMLLALAGGKAAAVNTTDYMQPYTTDGDAVDLYHLDYDALMTDYTQVVDYAVPYRWGYTVNLDTGTSTTERFTPQVPSAAFGTSVYFNGTNSRIEINPSTDHIGDFQNALTVEAWLRPARVTGVQRIVTLANCFALYLSDDKIVFWVNYTDNTPLAVTGTESIPVNAWTHVAGVWDGANLEVYINGVRRAVLTNAAKPALQKPNGTSDWQIIGASTGQAEYFKGHMDEIRISKAARFEPNVTDFHQPFVSDAGAVDLYHFDYDSLQGTNYASIVDYAAPYRWGYTVNVDTVNTTTYRFTAQVPRAAFGQSIRFNGIDSRMEVSPNASHIGDFQTSLTLEGWFRPEWTSGTQMLIFRANCHSLYMVGKKVEFWVNYTDTVAEAVTTEDIINANEWAHIAGVWDGKNLSIFVNGVRMAHREITGKPALRKPDGINDYQLIGMSGGRDKFYKGYMDEVRISKTGRYKEVPPVSAAHHWELY